MNNETNKTSVDYLWNLIPKDTQNYIIKQFNGLEKAKEMEKEIVIGFQEKYDIHYDNALDNNTIIYTKNEYYDETYGGNK